MRRTCLRTPLPPLAAVASSLVALAALLACDRASALPFGSGDAVRQTQPARPETPAPSPAAPQIEAPANAPPLALPEDQTLEVQTFKLEGIEALPEALLQAMLAPYRGRALSMAQINEAAGQITNAYRDRGYLLARAYVPRQDASHGTLLIRVLVGHYGTIKLSNQSRVRDGSLQRFLAPLSGSHNPRPVLQTDIERTMLLVSDLPGAALPKLTVSPGEAPGTSDFLAEVPAGPAYNGYVTGDNLGSRYTGRTRLSAGLDLNAPLHLGDRLSLSAMDAEGGGLKNGRLAYGLPLGGSGLRGDVALSRTEYGLGGEYANLDATGSARTAEATLSYPLLRGRERSLWLSANVANKALRDEVGAVSSVTDKSAQVGTLGLRYESWGTFKGLSSYNTANASLSYGYLGMQDAALAAQNRAGADTLGRYGRLNLALNTELALNPRWSLGLGGSLQMALKGKNLDSSEQMNIAGADGVRSYRETISGDSGYLLNAELRRSLPSTGNFSQTLSIFTDLGHVYLENGSYTTAPGSARVADIGVGYQVRFNKWFARFQLAQAVGNRPAADSTDSRTRALLSAGFVF